MQQIANQIEMMNLKRFVTRAQIFHEEYKNTVHPDYVDESKDMVRSFEKHFINSKPPSGLLPWCLRLEFSHAALIEKSMQVSMIYRKLMEQYPLLYILYTDDNSKNITMRVYFHRDLFSKSGVVDQNVIYTFMKTKLLKTLIRGIDGITSAMVLKEYVPRTIVQEDGSMKVIRKHIIRTSGTNLSELMKHQSVDVSKTSSNSILEIQELYGIDAARNKLIQCLREMSGSDINIKHYMLIADTLTYNGYISNIERSGIQESNPNNALLCMSYSHPIQAVTEAGINNETSFVSTNISSSLMMGTVPEIGSNYNTIVMNEEFIKSNTETVSDLLNDI
jgi:DNA-directed RNA polymerase beta' subunit